MEILKTNSDKLTFVIPLKETCGESIETAIEISGVHFNQIIPIESSIIQYLMDDMHWTKTEQYLIFAEGQAMRRIPMTMNDWIEKLHGFLNLNDREILTHAGKISHELAQQKAETEYDKFHTNRLSENSNVEGDFEKAIKNLPPKKRKKT